MPLQSRPFLLGLPRELRQQIVGYVFEDALAKDIRLNSFLRQDFRHKLRFSKLPMPLKQLLTRTRWLQYKPSKTYAPHICALARILVSVHPEFAGDVPFVLNTALVTFEKHQKTEMDNEYLPRKSDEREYKVVCEVALLIDFGSFQQVSGTHWVMENIKMILDYGFT
jgi:hypothetical protein